MSFYIDMALRPAYEQVCGWVDDPQTDSGIEFAGPDGSGCDQMSYPQLAGEIVALACRLSECGLRPGDNVSLVLNTGPEILRAIFASWRCGASITIIAPPGFAGGDDHAGHLQGVLRQARPRLILTSAALAPWIDPGQEWPAPLIVEELTAAPGPGEETRNTGAEATTTEAFNPWPGDADAVVQFTSGSTGSPRGVRITWTNLAANLRAIDEVVRTRPGDVVTSWLPLYHDMGLVGGLLAPISYQVTARLLSPDEFIRDPAAWVRAMSGAAFSVAPSFGLGRVAARVRPEQIAGLDLSTMRGLILGAEPVDLDDVTGFCSAVAGTGFDPAALIPAYGLAESTLIVTASGGSRGRARALRVASHMIGSGGVVEILDSRPLDETLPAEDGWVVGLGAEVIGSSVEIVDEDGRPVPEGVTGEVVVRGPSVAAGYTERGGRDPAPAMDFEGVLRTGDGGAVVDGDLIVFGRMGTSLKVRGAAVFMEDLDQRITAATGLSRGRVASIVRGGSEQPGVTICVEREPGEWQEEVLRVARTLLGREIQVAIVTGEPGLILRTSSGKPRRQAMWRALAASTGPALDRRAALSAHTDDEIASLLEHTLPRVSVDPKATIVLEGSIAEGFGNEGSDVDFLAIVPGNEATPEMPSVLFVDGRRVEVRTRSAGEIRRQLTATRALADAATDSLLDANQDVLNRCQRFLGSAVVRSGAVEISALRDEFPATEFRAFMTRWWTARTRQSVLQARIWSTLGANAEAAGWARDALLQGTKAWAATRGETYLEAKWTGPQLDRIGESRVTECYEAIQYRADRFEAGVDETAGGEGASRVADLLDDVVTLLGDLGVRLVTNEDEVVVCRFPGVTSWPIDGRIHVIDSRRNVHVLSDSAGQAWRATVFGRTPDEIATGGARDHREALAEFLRLGLIGVRVRGRELIRPAAAMCKPTPPAAPPPAALSPVLGVSGGRREHGRAVTTLPIQAEQFASCGGGLIWSNVIIENAREDLIGALTDGQLSVADSAAHRMTSGAVRLLLSAAGCSPLPPDVGPLETLRRLVPPGFEGADEVVAVLARARAVRFRPAPGGAGAPVDAAGELAVLDAAVATVRRAAGVLFPEAFRGDAEWMETLELSYDWLRMSAYLDADIPIDEAQDLLSSGGAQPHAAADGPGGGIARPPQPTSTPIPQATGGSR